MNEQAKAGEVKALATSGIARSAVTPSLPTVSEAGVPGYEATIWLRRDGAEGHAAARSSRASTRRSRAS